MLQGVSHNARNSDDARLKAATAYCEMVAERTGQQVGEADLA
jgi:hypothetical protein